MTELFAPPALIRGRYNVHTDPAGCECEHEALDEGARHIAIPAGIGVCHADDVQAFANRYTMERASSDQIGMGGCRYVPPERSNRKPTISPSLVIVCRVQP